MTKSSVNVDIPLAQDGKYVGYARLPHSVNRSAYGWLPIPLASIRNGDGPTILLMSGTHGDEYEGQVTLTRLIQQIEPKDISGQIIILPMANYPAALAGLRTSPIDGANLNRIYPGNAQGSVSEIIAHFIETELFSRADVVLDLHSGGSSLNYLPSSVTLAAGDSDLLSQSKKLMQLFGAPYGVVFEGRAGIGSSYDAAIRNNIIRIGTELGGRAWVDPKYREICENGVLRILAHFGVLRTQDLPAPPTVQFVNVGAKSFVYATADGIFEAAVSLGEAVKAGDLAGNIYFPATPLRAAVSVHFDDDGIVICERAVAHCQVGDCLFHLGKPA